MIINGDSEAVGNFTVVDDGRVEAFIHRYTITETSTIESEYFRNDCAVFEIVEPVNRSMFFTVEIASVHFHGEHMEYLDELVSVIKELERRFHDTFGDVSTSVGSADSGGVSI